VTAARVLADPCGEGIQLGLVVGVHALQPAGQVLLPGALGHLLAKLVTCSARRSSWAQWLRNVGEQLLLAGAEVVGPAQ
jgi:hypothetical protein